MHSILIIEDEEPLLYALLDKFSTEGFTVISAKNGSEGLKLALQKHPDLILLDILMPEMDGMETLNELRKDEWGKDVPVIMLTNLNDSYNVSQGMELKVNHYWVKSDWNINDLASEVKAELARIQRVSSTRIH